VGCEFWVMSRKDLYSDKIDITLCEKLIETYNISGKQLFNLGKSWEFPHNPQPTPDPQLTTHNSSS